MTRDLVVMVKGAGEMASGVAWRLAKSHFKVVLTEIQRPLAVRRAVSFCEAVYDGQKQVEGVSALLVENVEGVRAAWSQKAIPLIVDPELKMVPHLVPDVLVEATLCKRDSGLNIDDAPLVVALGPGFEAGSNADLVIETKRGHHLGRVYEEGQAIANTGVPGEIEGKTWERVLRSPADGIFQTGFQLGDMVGEGQAIAEVDGEPIIAKVTGNLRGLIRPNTWVSSGLKVGDIDPRGQEAYVETISEKARTLGGAVLEAILRRYNN